MKAWLAAPAVAAVAILASGCGGRQSEMPEVAFHAKAAPKWSRSVALPDAEQAKLLRDALVSEAKADREDHPTAGILVATRRVPCQGIFGTGLNPESDEDVCVVAASGNFTRYGASRPPGASAPQDTWLSLWFSADSIRPKKLNLTDLGLGKGDSSKLETCGTWMPLDLGSD